MQRSTMALELVRALIAYSLLLELGSSLMAAIMMVGEWIK